MKQGSIGDERNNDRVPKNENFCDFEVFRQNARPLWGVRFFCFDSLCKLTFVCDLSYILKRKVEEEQEVDQGQQLSL